MMLVSSAFPTSSDSSNATFREKALQYISVTYGIPIERLLIVKEGEANFQLTGQKLWGAKIMDVESHKIYGVYIDEAVDISDLQTAKENEELEYTNRYGKSEKTLHERLFNMQPQDKYEVGIWLKLNDTYVPKLYERRSNETITMLKNAYNLAEKPIIEFIRMSGFDVTYASQYAPLVFAELPKIVILEIEKRSDVDMIYDASGTFKPEIDTAALTERASDVWTYGINGSGISIAVVEGDGIAFANPYLADGSYYDSANPRIGNHATAVAGIIASINVTYRGIAYGALGLLSANAQSYSTAHIIAATEWALNNGASIINNSWGNDTDLVMTEMDRYLDHLVWIHGVTIVKSAGNRGGAGNDGDVTSPGLGWNVITVGGIDDKDTPTWSDDEMWTYSSWGDPISLHGDREKPEVVAVCCNNSDTAMYSTLTASPWIGTYDRGTSFAAPAVAGEAALLMQTDSSLEYSPELVKALIMASAWHNIEGYPDLSEYDGAGAISITRAYLTLRDGRCTTETLDGSSFPKFYTFNAVKGDRIRVAITWDSHTDQSHPPTTDWLAADLDLIIYDPTGKRYVSSCSYDNNYEIVEFTAPMDGTYKAEVNPIRFEGGSEFLGFAWDIFSENRYMRGDTHTVNGLATYFLGATQSATSQSYSRSGSGGLWVYYGTRVWKRSSAGVETEITAGTPVAVVSSSAPFTGIKSATWACPQKSLEKTDAIVVRVYLQIASVWYLAATFITERLNATQLNPATWRIYYYIKVIYNPTLRVTTGYFYWGTTTYNSRIENFAYTQYYG